LCVFINQTKIPAHTSQQAKALRDGCRFGLNERRGRELPRRSVFPVTPPGVSPGCRAALDETSLDMVEYAGGKLAEVFREGSV
jgi:hypothetical protein